MKLDFYLRTMAIASVTMVIAFALFGPAIVCAADEALAGAAKQTAPAETLEELAKRLKEATGVDWHLYTMPAGSAPRHLVWSDLPGWYGMATHYSILAASPADQVGRPSAEGGAIKLEVIATNGRYTVLSQPAFEPETAAKILAALGMTLSKEMREVAERHRLMESSALWLDFRCAAARDSSHEDHRPLPPFHGPTPQEIERYTKLFSEKGPNGGRQRGDPYFWFEVVDCCDVSPQLCTTRTTRGTYVLLSDKPEEVLLSGSKRPRPWHLKRVQATRDAQGRPAVELQFNETAAARMAQLTKANRGRALATLFFDKVVQIQVIDAEISDKMVISGKTFDEKLVKGIVRSLKECMLAENEPDRLGSKKR